MSLKDVINDRTISFDSYVKVGKKSVKLYKKFLKEINSSETPIIKNVEITKIENRGKNYSFKKYDKIIKLSVEQLKDVEKVINIS